MLDYRIQNFIYKFEHLFGIHNRDTYQIGNEIICSICNWCGLEQFRIRKGLRTISHDNNGIIHTVIIKSSKWINIDERNKYMTSTELYLFCNYRNRSL